MKKIKPKPTRDVRFFLIYKNKIDWSQLLHSWKFKIKNWFFCMTEDEPANGFTQKLKICRILNWSKNSLIN